MALFKLVLISILIIQVFVYHQCIGTRSENYVRNSTNASTNVVCYLNVGGTYNSTSGIPPPTNLQYCTHIIYLGSGISNNSELIPAKPTDVPYYYERVTKMKAMKPGIKVILSSGWEFSQVLFSEENMHRFANSVIPYLTKYHFDGLDLDWEFPAWGAHRSPQQRHNFTLVMKILRETFDNYTSKNNLPKFLLTTAVASTLPLIVSCYEIPQLSRYVDFINLMTYDIHGFSKTTPFTGHNSPLYSGKSLLDKTIFYFYNVVSAGKLWVEKGMKKNQIMVGIPAYAHTFQLLTESSHGVYSLATDYNTTLGDEINRAVICKLLKNTSFKEVWDEDCFVPYAYSGKTWISYENNRSIIEKVKWIINNSYGGIMTYSLDSDDYEGKECGIKWPIHKTINDAIKQYS